MQQAQGRMAIAQAAWAKPAVAGPETVEQAARSVYCTTLKSTQTTLLALHDSSAIAPDGNVRFVERHAVGVAQLSERVVEFTAAARSALDDIGG
ncbi:hypothetical protein KYY02_06105 [Streptomyces pimonensis]|uniref:Uncharacterized protein n=1 Tax=Streptomyces pimonensis TaxID=2860288 RepID=A0ABV4IUE1_9ACTN